jgi:RNA polymerase sigma-70 factor, ECF subfamily
LLGTCEKNIHPIKSERYPKIRNPVATFLDKLHFIEKSFVMTLDEEKELLEKIKDNPKFFGICFDAYYKPIFNYIFHRVADYDIARDIAADTFLKAYLKITTFTWKDVSILTWLYRIATNEVNYYYRKNKVAKISLDLLGSQANILFEFDDSPSEKQLLENELKLNEDFARAQRSLKRLNIKYQVVISLRFFEKLSLKEIAEILHKKEGTIKSLLSRGLNKLKVEFNNAT